ncbi:MAG: V-type ATP synthase subunit D [Candidatus Altarchaeum sp. CG03_land_8_20_14_0_80_32_618]|nr:V-type ATP synthase subunit D [Candidatus Altarchaeum hamiconexum]PIV27224.1 MAG: V-type ATP synthase subunit D [Candidatus Altarchaeum sp. CG03_land_8_20_14_0_80_32_618]PIX48462.1 MAG: V-type ATP synthase subunit D [Candidatus Altarchaeum sp. CG_4_8_14_3_um_filter_33_2054]
MAKQVSPTRMELLRIKQKIKLAQKGHSLLKKKRDALMMELFETAKNMKAIRPQIQKDIINGQETLIKAYAMGGPLEIKTIGDSAGEMPELNITYESVGGVKLPKIEIDSKNTGKIDYGVVMTSSSIDNSVDKFESIKRGLLSLIKIEEKIKRLAQEIIKTKRRVNSLEHILIPELLKTQKNIKAKLEEAERENFFRLKIVKKKSEKKQKNKPKK